MDDELDVIAPKDEEDQKPTRLKIITTLGYAIAAIVVGVLMSGIQGNNAEIDQIHQVVARLEDDVLSRMDKLEVSVETEIARLDESNRNRRNQIADLEVETATNAAKIEELRADIDRLLPPGTD